MLCWKTLGPDIYEMLLNHRNLSILLTCGGISPSFNVGQLKQEKGSHRYVQLWECPSHLNVPVNTITHI